MTDYVDEETHPGALPAGDRTARRPFLLVMAGPQLGELVPLTGEVVLGTAAGATLRLPEDDGVAPRHARIVVEGDGCVLHADAVVRVDGEAVRVPTKLSDGARLHIGASTIVQLSWLDELEERVQTQLLEQSLRDRTTGAYGQRYFRERLGAELSFADRHRTSVGVLLIDVDQLERVTQLHGRRLGDDFLRALVVMLRGKMRGEDVVGRLEGGRFGVIVRSVPPVNLEALAQRLCREVAGYEIDGVNEKVRTTVSIGVAVIIGGEPPGRLLVDAAMQRAESALVRAKLAGRNCARL